MQKIKMSYSRFAVVITMLILWGIGISFLFWRMKYGVDTTDEAMYIAMAYSVLRGNIPLVDLWEAQQSGSILMVPLLWIYESLNGDLNGSVLFLRYCFAAFSIVCAVVVFLLLKRYIKKEYCILFVGIPVFFGLIPNFSYNTVVTNLFYVTSAVFLTMTWEKDERKLCKRSFLLGCLTALLIYTYQTLIVLAIVYLLCISVYWWKDKKTLKKIVLYYCIAGGLVALFVCILLLIKCSVDGVNFIDNIVSGVLGNPHSEARSLQIERYYPGKSFLQVAVIDVMLVYLGSKAGLALFLWSAMAILLKRINKFQSLTFAGMIFYVIVFILSRNNGRIGTGVFWLYVSIMLIVLACLYLKKENQFRTLLCLFIPAMSVWAIRVATSLNYNCLGQIDVLSVLILVLPLIFQNSLSEEKEFKKYIGMFGGVLLSATLILTLCVNLGKVVYGDKNIPELTFKMEDTIYEGMYTNEERKEFVMGIQKWLDKYDDTGKTLFVMDHLPAMYMMSNAVPYAASTWSHTYHYAWVGLPVDLSWMEKYYEIHGNVLPEVIYTVEYEGGDYEPEHEAYKKFLEDYFQIADYQAVYSEKEYKFTRYELQK